MKTPAQRVALFGGAFDPFHNGHLATISRLLESGVVDHVVVIPSGDRPDKPSTSPALARLEMTRLGVQSRFAGDARIEVSDVQASGRSGYATVDLLAHFKKERPHDTLLVVIGPELVADLAKWKDPETLRREGHLLVVRRPGSPNPSIPPGWQVTDLMMPYAEEVDISSSELRGLLRRGERCNGMMPDEVQAFCVEERLYR